MCKNHRPKLERLLLLREIARRHRELADVPGDELESPLDLLLWESAMEYGPEFRPRLWFPGCSESERVRLSRELGRLANEGYVEVSRADGSRWKNARLTEQGEQLLSEIQGEQQ